MGLQVLLASTDQSRENSEISISAAIGQFSKPFTSSLFRRSRVLHFRKAFHAGGFPSTHSSAMVDVSTALGFEWGFMYDAQGVRREVGNHSRCLNKVLSEEKLIQIVSINDDNDSKDSIPIYSSSFVEKSAYFESAKVNASVLVESSDSRISVNKELELSFVDYSPLKEFVGHTKT